MSEAKRTPWYPASIKPARAGMYEVRSALCNLPYRCVAPHKMPFNGKNWPIFGAPAEPGFEWRGLAEDPQQAQEAAR